MYLVICDFFLSPYYSIYITSFIFQVHPEPPLDREDAHCPMKDTTFHTWTVCHTKQKHVYWPTKGTRFSLLDPVPGTEKKDFCPVEIPPFHTWILWSSSFWFFYFSLWFTVWKVMVILGFFFLTFQINLTFRSVLCSLQNCLESMESPHAPLYLFLY